eukprot:scaffold82109_cov26-Tisochrysis_lutea.AAC.4
MSGEGSISSAKWQSAMKPQPSTSTSSRGTGMVAMSEDSVCEWSRAGSTPSHINGPRVLSHPGTARTILPSIELTPFRAKIRAVVTHTPSSPGTAIGECHSASGRKKPPPCVLGPSPSTCGAEVPTFTKMYVWG